MSNGTSPRRGRGLDAKTKSIDRSLGTRPKREINRQGNRSKASAFVLRSADGIQKWYHHRSSANVQKDLDTRSMDNCWPNNIKRDVPEGITADLRFEDSLGWSVARLDWQRVLRRARRTPVQTRRTPNPSQEDEETDATLRRALPVHRRRSTRLLPRSKTYYTFAAEVDEPSRKNGYSSVNTPARLIHLSLSRLI